MRKSARRPHRLTYNVGCFFTDFILNSLHHILYCVISFIYNCFLCVCSCACVFACPWFHLRCVCKICLVEWHLCIVRCLCCCYCCLPYSCIMMRAKTARTRVRVRPKIKQQLHTHLMLSHSRMREQKCHPTAACIHIAVHSTTSAKFAIYACALSDECVCVCSRVWMRMSMSMPAWGTCMECGRPHGGQSLWQFAFFCSSFTCCESMWERVCERSCPAHNLPLFMN